MHPAHPEICPLSLHDALPICAPGVGKSALLAPVVEGYINAGCHVIATASAWRIANRSEEHTSELQSHSDLVCRLLLEKKKTRHDVRQRHRRARRRAAVLSRLL